MSTAKDRLKYLALIIITSLVALPHLDQLPIRAWDETRNAVHAINMLESGNFIVRYYEGEPDMWELKPPLLVWLQVLCMKIVGINELAVRLPTAIAVFGICFIIFNLLSSQLPLKWAGGYLGVLIFLSMPGFFDYHIGRSGDHDALLVLFLLTQVYGTWKFIKNEPSAVYLIACGVLGGVLSKSIAGLFFLPFLVIYLILYSDTRKRFFQVKSLFVLASSFALILVYYGCREVLNPGYISAVIDREILSSFQNHINNDTADTYSFWYYAMDWMQHKMYPWIFILFLFPLILLPIKRSLFHLVGFVFVCHFFMISIATKRVWYDAACYPLVAILCALALWQLYQLSVQLLNARPHYLKHLFEVVLASLIFIPYYFQVKRMIATKEKEYDVTFYALPTLIKSHFAQLDLNHTNIYYSRNFIKEPMQFYRKQLEINQNIHLIPLTENGLNQLRLGDYYAFDSAEAKHLLNEHFEYAPIAKYKNAQLVRLINIRTNPLSENSKGHLNHPLQ